MPPDSKLDRLFEVFRWNPIVNPNPPDPALAIVLELAGNPSLNKHVASAVIKFQLDSARASQEFWSNVQKSVAG